MQNDNRLKISVIGSGNVAFHLMKAWRTAADITQVSPRTLEGLPEDSDIYIISVSDNAIADVASRLRHLSGIVAHTSGTTPMSVLTEAGVQRPGVLYPLQTFSREVPLDYREIPVFVEGGYDDAAITLQCAAAMWSGSVTRCSSDTRCKIHLASVLACNFTNHLWALASQLLAGDAIPFDILKPLIRQTAAKIEQVSPYEAQTGPARRHDTRTIARHLEMTAGTPLLKQIYTLLSQSISDTYPKNGANTL